MIGQAVDSSPQETARGYVAGEARSVAEVERWIQAAAGGFRRRLGASFDDAVQEARLGVLQALRAGAFRGEAALPTYVGRIVVHACLRELRRGARWRYEALDEASEASPVAPHAVIDERFVERDAARALWRLTGLLPNECRRLWEWILEGLSYEEMSRRAEVGAGALRVRVLRCRRRARRELELRRTGNAAPPSNPERKGSP